MGGITSYQRTQIATADQRKIIVLLYEAAIARLNQAVTAHEAKDADRRVLHVNKALSIIHFLSSGLDFERGGEIARNLQRLYDYSRDIISEGNIKGLPEKFSEAARLLSTLLDAWRVVCSSASPNQTPPELERKTREVAASVAAVG